MKKPTTIHHHGHSHPQGYKNGIEPFETDMFTPDDTPFFDEADLLSGSSRHSSHGTSASKSNDLQNDPVFRAFMSAFENK